MDIREVNLNLLVHFRTLMNELSVSRAALRAQLTQPAMSHILAELRKLFDDPLFVRGPGGLVPTTKSMELSKQVFPILKRLDATLANQSPFDPKKSRRRFTIATNDYLSLLVMPKLLKLINKEAPNVQVEIVELANYRVEDLVSRNIDLMMAYHIKRNLEHPYHQEILFTDAYKVVVRKDHPTIKNKMTVQQFADLKHILVSKASGAIGPAVTFLEKMGKKPTLGFINPHYLVSMFIIAESDMVYLASEREYKLLSNLPVKILPCPLDIPADNIKLIWHEVSSQDQGCVWLRDKFKIACKGI